MGDLMRIGSSANATLDSVVLRNNSALNGGAILSRGNLDATDVSFVQNAASSLGGGLHLHVLQQQRARDGDAN